MKPLARVDGGGRRGCCTLALRARARRRRRRCGPCPVAGRRGIRARRVAERRSTTASPSSSRRAGRRTPRSASRSRADALLASADATRGRARRARASGCSPCRPTTSPARRCSCARSSRAPSRSCSTGERLRPGGVRRGIRSARPAARRATPRSCPCSSRRLRRGGRARRVPSPPRCTAFDADPRRRPGARARR